MTREEILAMEVGEELDLLVENTLFQDYPGVVFTPYSYSTDASATLQVIKRMEQENNKAKSDFVSWLMRPELLDIHSISTAFDTIHKFIFGVKLEAICKAALLTRLLDNS